jgi:hypothetical protein
MSHRLRGRAIAALGALRAFLAGATGISAARLDAGCAHGAGAAARARRALAERAARRPSCC